MLFSIENTELIRMKVKFNKFLWQILSTHFFVSITSIVSTLFHPFIQSWRYFYFALNSLTICGNFLIMDNRSLFFCCMFLLRLSHDACLSFPVIYSIIILRNKKTQCPNHADTKKNKISEFIHLIFNFG